MECECFECENEWIEPPYGDKFICPLCGGNDIDIKEDKDE